MKVLRKAVTTLIAVHCLLITACPVLAQVPLLIS